VTTDGPNPTPPRDPSPGGAPPGPLAVTALILSILGFLLAMSGCAVGGGPWFGFPFAVAGVVLTSIEIRALARGERLESDLTLLQPSMVLSGIVVALSLVGVGVCGCFGLSYASMIVGLVGAAL
jgi:hypothetical protein